MRLRLPWWTKDPVTWLFFLVPFCGMYYMTSTLNHEINELVKLKRARNPNEICIATPETKAKGLCNAIVPKSHE